MSVCGLPNSVHYYRTQVHYSWPLIPFGDKVGRTDCKGFPEQQGMSQLRLIVVGITSVWSGYIIKNMILRTQLVFCNQSSIDHRRTLFGSCLLLIVITSTLLQLVHQTLPFRTLHEERCNSRHTREPWQCWCPQRWRWREQAARWRYQYERSCTSRKAGAPRASERRNTG